MPTFETDYDATLTQAALDHLAAHLPPPDNGTYKRDFYPVVAAMKQVGYAESEIADWAISTARGAAEYTYASLGMTADNPIGVIVSRAQAYGFTPPRRTKNANMPCAADCGRWQFAKYYDWQGLCQDCAWRRHKIDAALDAALALHVAKDYTAARAALEAIAPETDDQKARHDRGMKATAHWIARQQASN